MTFDPSKATLTDWQVHLDELHEDGDEWAPMLIRALRVPMAERHRLTLVRMLYGLATARNMWVRTMVLSYIAGAAEQRLQSDVRASMAHRAEGAEDEAIRQQNMQAQSWPWASSSVSAAMQAVAEARAVRQAAREQADMDALVDAFGADAVHSRRVHQPDRLDRPTRTQWEILVSAEGGPLDLDGWTFTPNYVMPDGRLQVFAERAR